MKTAIRQKFVETQTMKVSFTINISKTDYTNYFQRSFKPKVIPMFGVKTLNSTGAFIPPPSETTTAHSPLKTCPVLVRLAPTRASILLLPQSQ